MVEKLRPDELEAFKEAFDMFDKNMDGTISTKELHAAMRRGGQNPTESEVQDMINTVNIDLREAILHKNIATGETSQVITSHHFSSLFFTSLSILTSLALIN